MANETKWTPGPWEVERGSEYHGPYVVHPYRGSICDLYFIQPPKPPFSGGKRVVLHQPEEAEANARLIAAAPDLYEALCVAEQALSITSDHFEEVEIDGEMLAPADLLEDIRTALARARGEA